MRNRLLIIESNEAICRQLLNALSGHHDVKTLSDGSDVQQVILEFRPELVLLSFHLATGSAIEICQSIRHLRVERQIQLLILGHGLSETERLQAFSAGADDIIEKSISQLELNAKIDVLMRLRSALVRATTAERKLEGYTRELERIVERRSLAIQATQDVAVFALAKLADSRDTETGEHLVRMRAYSQIIAEQLRISGPYQDQIDDSFLQDLFRSSPLHDIGKVGISDAILLKPGKLTPAEFDAMKQHVRIGAETLEEAAQSGQSGSFFHMAAQIARYHHERWDGQGYLEGLRGIQIPLAARIVSVADVFDALTSKRVYKEAFSVESAREMICQGRGSQFDPAIVDAFVKTYDKLNAFPIDSAKSVRFLAALETNGMSHYWGKYQDNSNSISSVKMLVVENGSAELNLLASWMRAAGMNVRSCANYTDAMQQVRDDCPKVVITSWGSTDPDCELFYRWIREEHLPHYIYTMAVIDGHDFFEASKIHRLGVDDVISQSISREELLARLNSAGRVIDLENHLRNIERRDPLTGLATLRYLNDQLKREWARTRNYRLPVSCVIIDIDDFSGINRKYGMETGDKVLQTLAKTISEQGRVIDYLCRLECDRLLLVLPECAEVNALRTAKRIEMQVEKLSVNLGDEQIYFSVCMGVAERTKKTPSLEALLDNAKIALEVAKSSGKRNVVCYQDCQNSSAAMIEVDQVREHLEHLTAAEIMTSPIVSIVQSEPVEAAVELLLQNQFNAVPVIDEQGKLTGVISEKDLMQALRKPDAWSLPIAEFMRRDVVRFEESEPAIQVYEFLSQAAIHRVIIVCNDRPTGVVSRGSCLRSLQTQDTNVVLGTPEEIASIFDSGIYESATLGQLRDLAQRVRQTNKFNEPKRLPI
ncbi:diguanylate cyclase [Bremerella cremea]|uniref:Diguanylate cyclase n=1 Tax=Bremerella cremea TaxID=1031537 RepID=A0A368KWP3_9BACT|nr:diguanylate cyclase [Bremerella cremea]RCS52789.1 diguanylate cyclase [Bremerella cremea]